MRNVMTQSKSLLGYSLNRPLQTRSYSLRLLCVYFVQLFIPSDLTATQSSSQSIEQKGEGPEAKYDALRVTRLAELVGG